MSEFDTIKKDLHDIPTWVWWVGAGVAAILFIVEHMVNSGGSTTASTTTTPSTDTTTGTTDTGDYGSTISSDLTGIQGLLSQILANQTPVAGSQLQNNIPAVSNTTVTAPLVLSSTTPTVSATQASTNLNNQVNAASNAASIANALATGSGTASQQIVTPSGQNATVNLNTSGLAAGLQLLSTLPQGSSVVWNGSEYVAQAPTPQAAAQVVANQQQAASFLAQSNASYGTAQQTMYANTPLGIAMAAQAAANAAAAARIAAGK